MIMRSIALLPLLVLAGCLGQAPQQQQPQTPAVDAGASAPTNPSQPAPEDPALAVRVVDYGAALRTAAIKLTGDLPTMAEMKGVSDATSYAAQIDKYLADPRFAVSVRRYFRDSFKMGGTISAHLDSGSSMDVTLETAPTFAASLVVGDQPLSNLFTQASGTCPTLDTTSGMFTAADCPNTPAVGLLNDSGVMAQFYSNMAFRRVRWVQETFVCTKFPAEYSSTPVPHGAGQYVSPWPFTSVTGGAGAKVDFQDDSSVVCANCHSTMNHIAPLFANFDPAGQIQSTIQVHTPVVGTPMTKLTDWLPSGEVTSWRYGKSVASLTDLGAAIAADPDVAECHVARAWNWMMSKTDIVNDLAAVPTVVIDPYNKLFATNGGKLKPVLRAMLVSDDFVKF
jgi:hypothetical protein